jgi:hypothetical protein
MIKKITAILFLALVCGCSKPLNIENEWTLLGHDLSEVETAFEQAGYFKKDKDFWAPRGATKSMDNFMLYMDSSSERVIGVWRMRLPTDLASTPPLFDSVAAERTVLLGAPESDTVIEDYGEHERRIIWRSEMSADSIAVSIALRQRAVLTSASYLMREVKQFGPLRGLRQ